MSETTAEELLRRVQALEQAVDSAEAHTLGVGMQIDDLVVKVTARLEKLEGEVKDQAQRWAGQGQRIDRATGTISDLLLRFEAWKTVGNEMVELVNIHSQRLDNHSDQLQTLGELARTMRDVVCDIERILDIKRPEGEPAPQVHLPPVEPH